MMKNRKNIPLSILQLPKKAKRHYTLKEMIIKTLFRIMLVILCIIFLFPVVWMLSNSFKPKLKFMLQ